MAELYPDAPIFTLFHAPGAMSDRIEQHRIVTSWLDKVPFARNRHRLFLPVFPFAIEGLNLKGYDLVLSSSHCVAKGVRIPEGARHLSYVHAPMRYMWDRFDDYFGRGRASLPVRAAAHALRPWMQRWDRANSARVDRFVANSRYIAEKIHTFYGREASVLNPPVELERFTTSSLEGTGKGGYFLWVGAFAPYKRADVAIEAFRKTGQTLILAGGGQEAKALAKNLPPNVKLRARVGDAELVELYRNCRAFIFTADEDFGLTPLEAQATGRPVIAFRKGGALETVTEKTGMFFEEQTAESLERALRTFDGWEERFHPEEARAVALRFSKRAFQERLQSEVTSVRARG